MSSALQMPVGVVLAVVVPVLRDRLMRREALQPVVEVPDQPRLVVVHVDGRRDVHRIDEAEAVRDLSLVDELLDLRRDVEVGAPLGDVEPQLLASMLHTGSLRVADGTRTRDRRDHNPELYRLSYRHRARPKCSRDGSSIPPPVVPRRLRWEATKGGFDEASVLMLAPGGDGDYRRGGSPARPWRSPRSRRRSGCRTAFSRRGSPSAATRSTSARSRRARSPRQPAHRPGRRRSCRA